MNILIWSIQIILSIKFLTAAFTHAFRQEKPTLQYGIQKMGPKSKPILAAISVLLALDAVMLILPRALGWDPMITIYAAAFSALMMLGSILFHLRCRETPKVWLSIILTFLAIFIIIGMKIK